MSLPASWYTSNLWFHQEKERIFRNSWLFVTSASRLTKPGDFFSTDLLGKKILLVRQIDGGITAFINACRHRGAPLILETEGTIKANCITCPYHAWTYNCDGSLRKAPSFADMEKEKYSLVKLRLHEICGLLFVNLGKSEEEDWSSLREVLTRYPFNDYHYFSTKTFEVACNWKVFCENYEECMHCSNLHPLFARNYELNKYTVHNRDLFSHHTCPIKRTSEELGTRDGEWLWIWPNLCLALYEKYYDTLQVIPISLNRTRLIVSFYGRANLSNEELENCIADVSFQTFYEDIAMCEGVQSNLESGMINVEGGTLHPEREAGVIFFDRLIREAMEKGVEKGVDEEGPQCNSCSRECNKLEF